MSAPVYNIPTTADVALVAATAKYVLGVKAHANSGVLLKSAWIEFEGLSSTGEPVLVEIYYVTFASNPPGTNSTSETPAQANGRQMTAGFTAARNWSADPTVVTVLEAHKIHPQSGAILQIPLGDEYDTALGEGLAIRATSAAGLDCRAGMRVSRC